MRNVVWLILLFVVAVVAALTLGDNDGMASFYWQDWRLDLSLNFFILAALLIGFGLMTAVQAVNTLIGLPARAREWRLLRLERAAQAALREALAEYFSGRYSRAHKAAQRAVNLRDGVLSSAEDHEFRTLAMLLGAGSLHRMQDRGRRDALLRQALRRTRGLVTSAADDGARLLAAEWALDDRDGPRAESLLAELPPGVARRTQALRLKLQSARLAQRPVDALQTARLLANHQAFSGTAAQGLLRSLAMAALDSAYDADQLRRIWLAFDAADHRDAFVAARAARRAGQLAVADEGRAWLRPLWERLDSLGADGRAEVALALVEVVSGLGADWLPRVETAQRSYPNEAAVQAAVGAVLMAQQLWGKAKRPLELAAADPRLAPRARRQALRSLSQLATEQGDEARATDFLRQAAVID